MNISSDWKHWVNANQKKIDNGFEREFVEKILSQVSEISPSDVVAQFHFKDSNGGNRYIDFMIENERLGFRLPIELDGLAKDQTHLKWNDFLRRQNDLHLAVGPVLRFTNAQLHHRSSEIIASIRAYLRKQSSQKQSRDKLSREIKELRRAREEEKNHNAHAEVNIEKYEKSLEEKERALKLQYKAHLNDFSAIERKLEESQAKVSELYEERESDMRNFIWASALVIISLVALVAYMIGGKSDPIAFNPSTNSQAASPVSALARVGSMDVANLPAKYLGKELQVCGTVESVNSKLSNVQYMNLGAPYPNQHVGIAVVGTALSSINVNNFIGKRICATGLLEKTKRGDLQIEVTNPGQLVVQQ